MSTTQQRGEVVQWPIVPIARVHEERVRATDVIELYFAEYPDIYPRGAQSLCAEHLLIWLRAQGFKIVPCHPCE